MNQLEEGLRGAGVSNPREAREAFLRAAAEMPRPTGGNDPVYRQAANAIRRLWKALEDRAQGIMRHNAVQDVLNGDETARPTLFGVATAEGRRWYAYRVVAFANALEPVLFHECSDLKNRGIMGETKGGNNKWFTSQDAAIALLKLLTEEGHTEVASTFRKWMIDQRDAADKRRRAAEARKQRAVAVKEDSSESSAKNAGDEVTEASATEAVSESNDDDEEAEEIAESASDDESAPDFPGMTLVVEVLSNSQVNEEDREKVVNSLAKRYAGGMRNPEQFKTFLKEKGKVDGLGPKTRRAIVDNISEAMGS